MVVGMPYLDSREWIYANSRGIQAQFASELIDELDAEPWNDATTLLVENLSYRMDLIEPKDSSEMDRFEEDIIVINNRYRAIVRTLTEIGVVQDEATADIPALLRLLISPA